MYFKCTEGSCQSFSYCESVAAFYQRLLNMLKVRKTTVFNQKSTWGWETLLSVPPTSPHTHFHECDVCSNEVTITWICFFFNHLCVWRSLKWVWTRFTCNITFFDESRVLRISRGETERMENKRYIMQKALSFISALFYAPLPPKPPSCWCQSSQELHTFPKTFIPICDFESLAGLR